MKLLLGGSPCTHWSIARTKNRETEPSGQGWELFRNYLIALEKFRPDFWLYENNKSMSQAIREQISKELGTAPIPINSALVSAQSRQRLYWTNIPGVTQPEDRGILLRDILKKDRDDWRPVGKWTRGLVFGRNKKLEILKTVNSPKSFTCTTRKGHPNNYICDQTRTKYSNLTIEEYEMLQTVPAGYTSCVPEKERFRMLGNGWTVDVIAHILSHCPGIHDTPLDVLSMYDGMSCGQIALHKLGADIRRYWATEIDRYAISTTLVNFPDTIQIGDAFQVREDGWRLDG